MPLLRNMEEGIRDLCDLLLTETDDSKAVELAAKLRASLHDYIAETRAKIALLGPNESAAKRFARRTTS